MGLLAFIRGWMGSSWEGSTTVDTRRASYWLNWRVVLCSIWILMSMVSGSVLIWKKESAVYEDEVWRPCLKSIHPGWLLAYRAFALLLLSLMLLLNVAVDGASIFYFYTQWTFMLVTLYFALGTMLSMWGCYRLNKSIVDVENGSSITTLKSNAPKGLQLNPQNSLRLKAGFLAYTFQIIFQMNAGAVMLTDTVFWFILLPFLLIKAYNLNFVIINMHSINAIFLLGETALNSMRFPWFRIGYFFLWTSTYVLFQWLVHAVVSIWWPYPFLDLSSSYAPLWYSSVALMHIPCYSIFLLIVKAKHVLLSKWFPHSYRFVQQSFP